MQVFALAAADFANSLSLARQGIEVGSQLKAVSNTRRHLLADSAASQERAKASKRLSRRSLMNQDPVPIQNPEADTNTTVVEVPAYLGTLDAAPLLPYDPAVQHDLATVDRNVWNSLEGMEIMPMVPRFVAGPHHGEGDHN